MVASHEAQDAADDSHTVSREMGCSHAEFRRTLQRTYADRQVNWLEDGAEIMSGGGSVQVRIGPERTRRIGLLALPSTRISLQFKGLSAAQRAAFMEHFELYFRRGGG